MKKNKVYKIEKFDKPYRSLKSNKKKARNIILFVVLLLVLGFVGYSISGPLANLFSGKKTELPKKNNSLVQSRVSSSENVSSSLPNAENDELAAAYLPLGTASDAQALKSFAENIKLSGFNAVIIELKNEKGEIFYQSALPSVTAVGAVKSPVDISAVLSELKKQSIVPIAKINAFCDSIGTKNPAAKIGYTDHAGWSWLDSENGKPWLNPYSTEAQNYISDIACELAAAGFEKIMVSSVMFPTVARTIQADFGPLEQTVSRADILSRFTAEIKKKLNDKKAEMYLEFDMKQALKADNVIYGGANPISFSADKFVPSLKPMSFTGKLTLGAGSLEDASADTEATTLLLISELKLKNPSAVLIPELSGIDDGSGTAYTDTQVLAQKNACKAKKTAGYYLFDKSGNYTGQRTVSDFIN